MTSKDSVTGPLEQAALAAKKVQVVLRKNGWVYEYAFREEGEGALYSEPIFIGESHPPAILQ